MSLLADVTRLTNRFMDTKAPADFQAWSAAYELMTKEEEDKVGGGIYVVNDV